MQGLQKLKFAWDIFIFSKVRKPCLRHLLEAGMCDGFSGWVKKVRLVPYGVFAFYLYMHEFRALTFNLEQNFEGMIRFDSLTLNITVGVLDRLWG
jgi:hypothetical protein